MSYLRQNFIKSCSDAWDVVFANHPWTVVFIYVAACLAIYLQRTWGNQSPEQMKEAFISIGFGLIAYAILFAAVLLFNFFYLTPRSFYLRLSEQPKSDEQPRIRLDVADEESRKEIIDLRKELASAQETIKKQQDVHDPLSAPIASARFTLAINFKTKKEAASNYFGDGAAVMLVSKTGEQMLSGGVATHTSDGDGHSQVVIDCPYNAPSMGKPIRSLSEAHLLVLQFATGLVPLNTELNMSSVVLVVNNQVTLLFRIPAMTVINKTMGASGTEGTAVIIQDLKDGLVPLTTPPSPTPDKGASPP